jgi:methionyl-tRNA synthetase
MLMSVGLPQTHTIVINGFINSGGKKMSKSLGNVISPFDVVSEYGTDALRYYVAREISTFEDGDMTMEKFKDAYNANLANGLGNLVSRVMKMAEDNLDAPVHIHGHADETFFEFLNNFEIGKACDYIWLQIGLLDQHIQETAPFKVVKTDKEMGKKIIEDLVGKLYAIAEMLESVLPDTSTKIKDLITRNKSPEAPLFLRKD